MRKKGRKKKRRDEDGWGRAERRSFTGIIMTG
jgi:hypothetical protein